MKTISKKEMKDLFKKHNLKLDFPVDAENGNIVTDWSYWYHSINYEDSNLKKFRTIIETQYNNKYELYDCGCGGSIGIKLLIIK